MNFLKIVFFIWLLTLTTAEIYGQMPDAEANFVISEKEITTTPEFPGICDLNIGIEVLINETFQSYLWISPSGNRGGNSRKATLKEAGEWTLRVGYEINGVSCFSDKKLFVANLKDPAQIKLYFEKAGFYAVDISRNIPDGEPSGTQCDPENISFGQGQKEPLRPIIQGVFNNFKPLSSLGGGNIVISENNCLCGEGADKLEEQFKTGSLNVWAHQFFAGSSDALGKLFIKGRMPFDDALPIPTQKSHLYSIHSNILSANSGTSEQGRVIFSNLFMPHPIGGYDPAGACSLPSNWNDTHFLTPPKIAVQLPPDASNVHFAPENTGENIMEGVVFKFNSAGKIWHGYEREETESIFNGFFNEIHATFYESFTAGPTLVLCRGECNINITTTNSGCNQGSCRFVTSEYTSDDFDISNVADGGFDLVIDACTDVWINSPISWDESKKFIYDLMCAIKTNQLSISYDAKFADRVIFAKDIHIGDQHYPIVGVIMPEAGITITLKPDVDLDSNGPDYGFKNSFKISYDNNVRLNFFNLKDYVGKACSKTILDPSYRNQIWNVEKYQDITLCLKQSEQKEEFLDYVYPPNDDNLLIFVNGYRPGVSWNSMKKGNLFELTTKTPKDALNLCNDNYEKGNYWKDTGNAFIGSINNKNVIYVDGHHSIGTSNHRNMAAFAVSAGLCVGFKNFVTCDLCVLNNNPNPDGFKMRYEQGRAIGQQILDNIVQGKLKVKRDALGRISGKIDIVAHSMGYAVAKGIADFLEPKLSINNKLGYFYIIAPENAVGSNDSADPIYRLATTNFDGVFQYGSDFKEERRCRQDGIAPQIGVNASGLVPNVFIPEAKESIRNFLDAHYIDNYGWIFTDLDQDEGGYVKKRNP